MNHSKAGNGESLYIPFSETSIPSRGFAIVGETLYDTWSERAKKFTLTERQSKIMRQGLLAAFGTLTVLGYDSDTVLKTAEDWPGLQHRLEEINGDFGGISCDQKIGPHLNNVKE